MGVNLEFLRLGDTIVFANGTTGICTVVYGNGGGYFVRWAVPGKDWSESDVWCCSVSIPVDGKRGYDTEPYKQTPEDIVDIIKPPLHELQDEIARLNALLKGTPTMNKPIEHTPTPWTNRQEGSNGIWSKSGRYIGSTSSDYEDYIANAEFIVHAVNNHTQLQAKAELLDSIIENLKLSLQEYDGAEINPCNYNHEDVCLLNANYVNLFMAVDDALTRARQLTEGVE